MVRVVLDTNVVVSALMRRSSPPATLLDKAIAGAFLQITSAQLGRELESVLYRPRVRRRIALSDGALSEFLMELNDAAVLVTPAEAIAVARDADDSRVLEAAVAGAADYIVTGDRDLLALGSHAGVQILTPAQFVELLPT